MTLRTKLTELLGIRHPVLLAPMGGTAGGALAGAVSLAGGLGLIGGGDPKFVGSDWLEREFLAAGNRRVGCGFITWALAAERPELLDLVLRHRPAALMLSFGDATPFLPRIKAAGIPMICQVQSVAQARQVLEQGADIIVAQGTEAGGHGARRATLPLVPAVVDMVAAAGRDVPVVAAGGITDGRGLAAALMLGAAGVLMGTRFNAAEESLLPPEAKRRIVAGSGDDTLRSKVFDVALGGRWPREYDARTIANRFTDTWYGQEAALTTDAKAVDGYMGARAVGDFDTAAVYAGEGIDLIRAVEPAGKILERVVAEAEVALAQRFA
jgi:nitronate monooxygenase